ncbi:SufD family Fe-S cluster assembly protein [Candidatus Woesebacteria bacterium]|nr:SufD family Fe-S cluster assembly protein [Candidatus Woesebacteria bacterium]
MTKYTINKDEKKDISIKESGEYIVELVGQGAQAEIFGNFLSENNEKIDVKITIIHKAKNTMANTTLRGVGRDKSTIKFFGKIIIEENCGQSNSFLTERVLLLSDDAKAETIPELEILTDDVKCSHAASISRIPELQLFYLESRGISKHDAENLIIDGFLQPKKS